MSLKIVFWDWSGTLISDAKLCYPNSSLIKNRGASLQFRSRFDFVKPSWFLVEKFLSLHLRQIIVTNGIKRNVLKFLNFNPFDMILTSEEYPAKPNIDMFEYASSFYNVKDKNEMIMIGDSQWDKIAAENFKIEFFDINDHFNSVLKIINRFDLI